jgi:lipoyl-dependent peroxiredoxin
VRRQRAVTARVGASADRVAAAAAALHRLIPTEEHDTMATRNGSAEWHGDLQSGSGTLSVGDGVFEGNYSFASRFEEGEGTNPEELIAAAHASCFAMALSNILAEHGHPATSVRASARVGLRNIDGAPTIDRIVLEVVGEVPGIDQDHFTMHAEEAKEGCPVSRALAGVQTIDLDARLA